MSPLMPERRGAARAGRSGPLRRLLGLGLILAIALSPLAGLIFGLFALLWAGAARARSHARRRRRDPDTSRTRVTELPESKRQG